VQGAASPRQTCEDPRLPVLLPPPLAASAQLQNLQVFVAVKSRVIEKAISLSI
jgi:hypothetical protein